MFGPFYWARRFFAARYFPAGAPEVKGSYFGARFFAKRFFAGRYFNAPPATPTIGGVVVGGSATTSFTSGVVTQPPTHGAQVVRPGRRRHLPPIPLFEEVETSSHVWLASGGIVAGGAAKPGRAFGVHGVGGALFSGVSHAARSFDAQAFGGLELSGTAQHARARAFRASGEVLLAGIARVARGRAFRGGGGELGRGGASVQFSSAIVHFETIGDGGIEVGGASETDILEPSVHA